ncbi:MAG: hypothetical protein QM523_00350 [Candidatus Pacebacteria bacterium]|nr:hypothetical protein [Candidatus Paceibacterota bacterium]
MKQFIHHPDGYVIIINGQTRVQMSQPEFATAATALTMTALPSLPAGQTSRRYDEDAGLHCVSNGMSQSAPEGVAYPDATFAGYIEAADRLLAHQTAARTAAAEPAAAAPADSPPS